MRLFVLARHAESVLNLERRVSGDPTVAVPLTPAGELQARRLGDKVANIPFEVCVHTRFGRTTQTAEIALAGREVPLAVEPLLDDIRVGDLDGEPVDAYRAWKDVHGREAAFPGGESLDDAARRYAEAFRRLLALPHGCVLAVVHEISIRYALNGAAGSSSLDGPAHEIENAVPYLFDGDALARAAEGIETILRG